MSKKAKPKPIGKERAAALRAEIDKLTGGGGGDSRSAPKEPSPPRSPRDFIQRWMAEHDKPDEKK